MHANSFIHPNATIGKNVRIDAFTIIEEDVEIGDNTWIGSNVIIMNGARIRNNCQIFHGSIISAPPADLKFDGEQTTAENGDIVVALVEEHEATLKRFRLRGAMIALEAATPAYETLVFPDHMVKVQGRLVGLIRNY